MKIQFLEPNLLEDKRYSAEIIRYALNENHRTFKVYARIDKEPALEFMKKMELDLNVDSNFALLCSEMGIFTESGEVELDELVGKKVIVRLKRARDDRLYVSDIVLDKKYYKDQEGE